MLAGTVDVLLEAIRAFELVVIDADGDEHVRDEVEHIHELLEDTIAIDEGLGVTPVLPVELAGNLARQLDGGREEVVFEASRNLSRRLISRPGEAERFSLEVNGGGEPTPPLFLR